MIEREYQNPNKVYVLVEALFTADGRLEPTAFTWEDGRRFEIDRILEIKRAASMKAGGIGMRYTCRVLGKVTNLWLENGRWFMERK